jgi:hypothetical protein
MRATIEGKEVTVRYQAWLDAGKPGGPEVFNFSLWLHERWLEYFQIVNGRAPRSSGGLGGSLESTSEEDLAWFVAGHQTSFDAWLGEIFSS